MTLDVAARITDLQKKDDLLHEASKTVEQAIDELHNISQGLRPTILDDLGLKEALEWYTQYFEERYNLAIACNFEDIGALSLTAEREITAYRFLQEALMNAYKHAHASKVIIKLRLQANFMMLSATDDGIVFEYLHPPVHQNRLALVGGELIIYSQTKA